MKKKKFDSFDILDIKITLDRTEHASLLSRNINDKRKKFNNLDTWCQYYETFFFIADDEAQ